MRRNFYILFLTLFFYTIGWVQVNAQKSCIDTLISRGISLDQTDMKWLSDCSAYCRAMVELTADASALMIASVQTLIKLESNNLMNLPADQLDANGELLTRIIHGAFIEHDLSEQTQLSAVSWYQIFMRQMRE